MILGLGVDMFDVSRMERVLHEGDAGFLQSLFTTGEIAYCRGQRRPAEHYAARVALKEATFKALALADDCGASWRDVEIAVDPHGTRSILLHGRVRDTADRIGVARVLTSIAHTRGVAIASAVLESQS